VHTRIDHEAGLRLGHDVAAFVLGSALLPDREGWAADGVGRATESTRGVARRAW
jgi:hypothetical protein